MVKINWNDALPRDRAPSLPLCCYFMVKYPKLCLCAWASTGRLMGDFSLFLPPRVFVPFHHLNLTKTFRFSRPEKIAIIVGSNPITKIWHLPKDLLTYCSPFFRAALTVRTYRRVSSHSRTLVSFARPVWERRLRPNSLNMSQNFVVYS